jgi:hypothetical protein
MAVACPYKDCKMMLIGPDQVSHPKECPNREIRCPVTICDKKTSPSKVLEHFYEGNHKYIYDLNDRGEKEQQGRNVSKVDIHTFFFNWAIRPIHMTLGTGEDFFLQSARDNNQWIFWVVYVGSDRECKKFEAQITMEKGDKNEGNCISLSIIITLALWLVKFIVRSLQSVFWI